MTDLERRLTAALERLSAQYEMEQRRQSEQVEAFSAGGQPGSKERSWLGIQAKEYRPGTPPPRRGRRAGENPAVVAGGRSPD